MVDGDYLKRLKSNHYAEKKNMWNIQPYQGTYIKLLPFKPQVASCGNECREIIRVIRVKGYR